MAEKRPLEDLFVAEVVLSSFQAYKVVGDEDCVLEYGRAHPPRELGDWSALYFQFNEPHALGTVSYRWDKGYELARMLRLTIRDVAVLIVDAPWFPDASISGEEKAALVREALDVSEGVLLSQSLERRRRLLVCRETDDQWELIIPHALLPHLDIEEEVAMELRPNAFGATGFCRLSDSEEWRRFEEKEALQEVPPPSWISEALEESNISEKAIDLISLLDEL